MPTLNTQDMKDLAIAVFATFLGVFATQTTGGGGGDQTNSRDRYLQNQLFQSLVVAMDRKNASDEQIHKFVSIVHDNIANMDSADTEETYNKWRRQLLTTLDNIQTLTPQTIISNYSRFKKADDLRPNPDLPAQELTPEFADSLAKQYAPKDNEEWEAQLSIDTVLKGDGIQMSRIIIAEQNLAIARQLKGLLKMPFHNSAVTLIYRPASDDIRPILLLEGQQTPLPMGEPATPENVISDHPSNQLWHLLLPDIRYVARSVAPKDIVGNPKVMFCASQDVECSLLNNKTGRQLKINDGNIAVDTVGHKGYVFVSIEAAKYLQVMLNVKFPSIL
jgi:hypothetical protein